MPPSLSARRAALSAMLIGSALLPAAVCATRSHAEPPAASEPSASPVDAAVQALTSAREPSEDEVSAIEKSIESDRSPRADYARALILAKRGKWKDARESMRAVLKVEPRVAAYHEFFGNAIFSTVMSESTLDQMSLADEGKAAYEKAVELDPTLVGPRKGLAQFYINAPAIAGGSYRKAREQAEALLKIEGGKGEFQGRMILAQIAGARERWDEMAEQFRLAESARGAGAGVAAARRAHAFALYRTKSDPAAALAILDTLTPEEQADTQVQAVRGLSLAKLERWPEAIAVLTRVVEKNPAAQNSRIALGESLEATGKLAEAKAQFEEYLTRFPEGQSADKAKKAIRRIDRQLKR